MDEYAIAAARAWCEGLAPRLDVQHIASAGRPYLDRYFASGWSPTNRQPGPAVFVHHFLASDPSDAVHSHPWTWGASVILVGGYREYRCTDAGSMILRDFHPGDVNTLTADDKHRIELLASDCWTLFLAGDFAKPWTFAAGCGASEPTAALEARVAELQAQGVKVHL